MAAEAKHRETIVAAAAHLFRQRGFAATGMNDIVAESGAPKGSIYHYFPDGKAQIGAEALAYAGEFMKARILALLEKDLAPAPFLRAVMDISAGALAKSGYRNGCTVAGVVLDTPPTETRIMQAATEALCGWCGIIEGVCARAGLPQDRAAFIASVAISAYEGALIQARAAGDLAPMHAAADALAILVDAELAKARRQDAG